MSTSRRHWWSLALYLSSHRFPFLEAHGCIGNLSGTCSHGKPYASRQRFFPHTLPLFQIGPLASLAFVQLIFRLGGWWVDGLAAYESFETYYKRAVSRVLSEDGKFLYCLFQSLVVLKRGAYLIFTRLSRPISPLMLIPAVATRLSLRGIRETSSNVGIYQQKFIEAKRRRPF